MRIQIVTNLYPLPWDPNRATFNKQQFAHLGKYHDLRITVLVSWIDSLFKSKPRNPKNNRCVTYLSYYYIPWFARFTHAATVSLSLLLDRRQLRIFRPDCLLLSWAYPDAVATMFAARKMNLPTVIKVHGGDINIPLLSKLRAKQILWALHRADAIICVSQALAQKLVDHGIPEHKINVIYNGIDREVFYPRATEHARHGLELDQTRKIILFVGNLKLAKGCVDLLEAFIHIADRASDTDLYFIGSGKQSAGLKSRAEEKGLSRRVTLLGALQHEQINSWLNASNLLALPSHNEGVPNVLLESMACGTPVVATNVGGIPEVVPPEAGILVEPYKIKDLAEALLDASDRDWDRDAISRAVEKFDWDKNARAVSEVLSSAVARRVA